MNETDKKPSTQIKYFFYFAIPLLLELINLQIISMFVFDQLSIVFFFFIAMASPLVFGIALYKPSKKKIPDIEFLLALILTILRLIMLFTEMVWFYNILGGLILGLTWIFFGFLLLNNKQLDISKKAFFMSLGFGSSLFITFLANILGNSLIRIEYNSIVPILFLIIIYGHSNKIIPHIQKDNNFDEQKKVINETLSKTKNLLLFLAITCIGFFFYTITEIYSYPAMISAKTKTISNDLYFSITIIELLFFISFVCFTVIGFYCFFVKNSSSIESSSKLNKRFFSKTILILNLFAILTMILYLFINHLIVGLLIAFSYSVLLLDLVIIFYIIGDFEDHLGKFLITSVIASFIQYGLYAFHYFYLQLHWIPLLGFSIFTLTLILFKKMRVDA